MTPKVFGLAEFNDETGEVDPEHVRFWGMETAEGSIVYWREQGRSQFAIFDSANSAEARFGAIFGLALVWP